MLFITKIADKWTVVEAVRICIPDIISDINQSLKNKFPIDIQTF